MSSGDGAGLPQLVTGNEIRTVETSGSSATLETLHALFVRQAGQTPHRVALHCAGQEFTYRELDRASNRIANRLLERGLTPGQIVGVCLQRHPLLVATLLGILKVGCGYLPLDPAFPTGRLAQIVADAQAPLVVTEPTLEDLTAGLSLTDRLVMSEEHLSAGRDDAVSVDVLSTSLAYVIYTSGSTGRPKGVEISHRSVTNFLASMRQQPGMSSDDRILALTTISFDISVLEIFLPLSCGAEIVLVNSDAVWSPDTLVDVIEREDVTVMQATPTAWRLLLETGWRGKRDLKALCGGEAMPPDLARALLGKVGALWNMYGPTETTVWSTLHKVSANDGGRIPIGRPIAHTVLYVLDEDGAPVNGGLSGELYIGGRGLARGYRNQPQLTDERFLVDPFANEAGARMYRTGDIVRSRPDGSLEFIGRADHQIKCRGYRIEPGDIEAALNYAPGIKQSVVTAETDPALGAHLVGYLIGDGSGEIDIKCVRESLVDRVPSYMVPSRLVVLEQFPLTPNGKIDRKALASSSPLYECGHVSLDAAFSNPTERMVAAIWGDVFGLAGVGPNDDFFGLGGNSLMATRIFAQIEQRTRLRLPLGTLLRAPTVRALAAVLESQSSDTASLVAVNPNGSRPPIFCVGGGVLHLRNLSVALGDNQPFYALQAEALDSRMLTRAAFDEIAEQLIAEIKSVRPNGPYLIFGSYASAMLSIKVASRLKKDGDSVLLVGAFNQVPNEHHSSVVRRVLRFLRRRDGKTSDSDTPAVATEAQMPRRFEHPRLPSLQHVHEYVIEKAWPILFRVYRLLERPMPQRLLRGYYAELLVRSAVAGLATELSFDGDLSLFLTSNRFETASTLRNWGWSETINGAIHVFAVPGIPCTMFDPQNAAALARAVESEIDRAIASAA